ncbi:MAG TPA: hypothetical protein DEG28_01140 [Porphyromonadaceae bacterium]|nr:hypothetical protein [Porphyromonadaceae bacterium]
MKRTVHFLLVFLSSIILFSCSYDDTDIWSEIDKIKSDLTSLNQQVSSLETVVDALNAGKVITKVDKLDGENGYKITFNDGKTIDVLNGENAPVVGIQESEGIYYWTVTTDDKTEFLLDANKNKLPVSGETPILSIDKDGYWMVNNTRITDANGKAVKAQGDSFFKEVKEDESSVTFVLADNSAIVLPKSGGTYLSFESGEDELPVTFYPEEQKQLNFKAANIQSLEVAALPDGWNATIDISKNNVTVTASPNPTENIGKVVIEGLDKNGMVFRAIAKVGSKKIDFVNPLGVYILNEGSVWGGEDGSLIYITPDKYVLGNIYYNINGRAPGNCTQDLFIKNGKMYIIIIAKTKCTENKKRNVHFLHFFTRRAEKRNATLFLHTFLSNSIYISFKQH